MFKVMVLCWRLGDYFNMNGDLYEIHEFKIIYYLIAIFVHFQGICNAIVKSVKNADYSVSGLKNVSRPLIPPILSHILKNEKGSQQLIIY
jgi:hypothetical protein